MGAANPDCNDGGAIEDPCWRTGAAFAVAFIAIRDPLDPDLATVRVRADGLGCAVVFFASKSGGGSTGPSTCMKDAGATGAATGTSGGVAGALTGGLARTTSAGKLIGSLMPFPANIHSTKALPATSPTIPTPANPRQARE